MAMTSLAVATIVAAGQRKEFDPLQAGMEKFRGYARQARYGVIDTYPKEVGWYAPALESYVECMATGISLVCTATEAQKAKPGQKSILVGEGFVASAAAAVVKHELTQRMLILEGRHEASALRRGDRKHRWGGYYQKRPGRADCASGRLQRRQAGMCRGTC